MLTGERLVAGGLLTQTQRDDVLVEQTRRRALRGGDEARYRFASLSVEVLGLRHEDVRGCLHQHGFRPIPSWIDWKTAACGGVRYYEKRGWVVLGYAEDKLQVASLDPLPLPLRSDVAAELAFIRGAPVSDEHVATYRLLQRDLEEIAATLHAYTVVGAQLPRSGQLVGTEQRRRQALSEVLAFGQTRYAEQIGRNIHERFEEMVVKDPEALKGWLQGERLIYGQVPPIAPPFHFCEALKELLDLGLDARSVEIIARHYREDYSRRVEKLREHVHHAIGQNSNYLMYGVSSVMEDVLNKRPLPPGSRVFWMSPETVPSRRPWITPKSPNRTQVFVQDWDSFNDLPPPQRISGIFFGVHAIGSKGLVVLKGTDKVLRRFPNVPRFGIGGPHKRWNDGLYPPQQIDFLCGLSGELEFIQSPIAIL